MGHAASDALPRTIGRATTVTTDQPAPTRRREVGPWALLETMPRHPRHRVLMLPGLFCTAEFYTDMLTDPVLTDAGVTAIAADPPGFAGRPVPSGFGYSVESYAALIEDFAAVEAVDLVVGHSFMANVGIEIAARGRLGGRLLLLSPALSREDEEDGLRALDGASRTPVLRTLVWMGINPALHRAMRGRLPLRHSDHLLEQMRRNPRAANRRLVVAYFDHMARHGGLAERLASSRVPVRVARGERDEVAISAHERALLTRAPHVTLTDIPGAAHFAMTDTPWEVNRLVLETLGGQRGRRAVGG
jgi:pimeloyl-ACP methyl ester carboxylesterase